MRCGLLLLVAAVAAVAADKPILDGRVRPDPDGSFSAYMVPPYFSNHASTIEQLNAPDGVVLAAAWFSGQHEEASDCAIVFSRLLPNSTTWEKPITVSIRDKYSNQNPVLFWDGQAGQLHLFHSQAPANAGESQSTIWHLTSSDFGATWTSPALYFSQPGAFPRNRIIRALDGGILFPIYNASSASSAFDHENYSIIARGTKAFADWQFDPIAKSEYLVQPTVVREMDKPSSPELTVFFRDRRHEHVYRATSSNDGKDWSTPKPTVLPNNNAGIEAFTLQNNHIVLVHNPTTKDRNPLTISVSQDRGETWPCSRVLQHDNSTLTATGAKKGYEYEFSYPSVLQTADGNIHVTFTYNRQTIKYMRFNEDWIQAGC